MIEELLIFIIVIGLPIELLFSPRFEITRNRNLLLFYNKDLGNTVIRNKVILW